MGISADYLVRDNDRAYGLVFQCRIRAMGIRDRPISPSSPWQNGIAERPIGTLRRECLDQMLVFGEAHLRRILSAYATYYNQARTHMALQKMLLDIGRSSETEPLSPYPFWRFFIIDTRGYDFRKGQGSLDACTVIAEFLTSSVSGGDAPFLPQFCGGGVAPPTSFGRLIGPSIQTRSALSCRAPFTH